MAFIALLILRKGSLSARKLRASSLTSEDILHNVMLPNLLLT